jgi:hypothetical protein
MALERYLARILTNRNFAAFDTGNSDLKTGLLKDEVWSSKLLQPIEDVL